MHRYQYWLGWTYQYVFWSALILLGWYFLGKSWGPTAPFWEREQSRLVEKRPLPSLLK